MTPFSGAEFRTGALATGRQARSWCMSRKGKQRPRARAYTIGLTEPVCEAVRFTSEAIACNGVVLSSVQQDNGLVQTCRAGLPYEPGFAPSIHASLMLLRLVLAFTCCLLGGLAPDAAAQSGRTVEYRVHVQGPKELVNMLQEGLNIVRWQHDPEMSAELLERLVDEAVREARQAVATEGYFSAEVLASIDRSRQPWRVDLQVEPGPRTRIAAIDVRFTGPAADDPDARAVLQRIRRSWSLRRDEPFRQRAWDEAKEEAVRQMAAWRYAAAQVARSEALIDPKAQTAALMVEIESGPPFQFGPIEVVGARRYPEQLVRNLSPVNAGEVFDREKLLIYQRRLHETGYYVSAQVDVDSDPLLAAAAPVRVAVIEGNSQNVEAGIGYSTDTGARFELRYGNVDVFDSAWRFRSGLRLDQKLQNLTLELDSPPRSDGSWNNFFSRFRQANIQNESTSEFAVGFTHNWGLERIPSAFIASAHVEEQRVAGSVTDQRHAIYFGYRPTFRRTDDPVSPRSGYLGTVEVGGAPGALATRQFIRVVGSLSVFLPLGRRDDLLLRSQVGAVLADARDGIPSSFLFRTGGDQTVRGYAFESIGVQQGEAIVGGRFLAVGSVEYTRWIGESWGLAAFVDAGDAWDERTVPKAAWGYGIGARFRTPIGPIRADLALGERTGVVRLHLSAGFTF
jgi:translocation and assembly module TamA